MIRRTSNIAVLVSRNYKMRSVKFGGKMIYSRTAESREVCIGLYVSVHINTCDLLLLGSFYILSEVIFAS